MESEVQVENWGGQVGPNAQLFLTGHVLHISIDSLGRRMPLYSVLHPYLSAFILLFYGSSPLE